jgi:hypothetical protein
MVKSKKTELLSREESCFVSATIIVNGIEIQNVACKVYFPERTHEKPYLLFKPSRTDAVRMTGSFKGVFKANIIGLDKELQTTMVAPEVHFSENSTKYWGSDISESTILGEPQNLHIIDHLKNRDEPSRTNVEFWISPNTFISPLISQTSSYTGEIKHKRLRKFEFTIKGGTDLKFDKRFQSKTLQSRDLVQWSHLIAHFEMDKPAIELVNIKDELLQDIDDFLLLVSVASRRRTACLGWTAYDNNSITKFYRGNYSFPDVYREVDLNDVVVDLQDFKNFMKRCYPSFQNYENKLALRNAMHSAIASNPHSLEASYLSMFAGLETLILDFRRTENIELVLPKSKFQQLRKYLKECVKKSTKPELSVIQQDHICNKLGELNRVSLREAFEMFCDRYVIGLSDLWPVFGENGVVGLVDIRNKLIHGDPLPHDAFGALIVAKEHLSYTLERILLRVLGWEIEKSKVNPSFLAMYGLGLKDLRAEMGKLTEYMSG